MTTLYLAADDHTMHSPPPEGVLFRSEVEAQAYCDRQEEVTADYWTVYELPFEDAKRALCGL